MVDNKRLIILFEFLFIAFLGILTLYWMSSFMYLIPIFVLFVFVYVYVITCDDLDRRIEDLKYEKQTKQKIQDMVRDIHQKFKKDECKYYARRNEKSDYR